MSNLPHNSPSSELNQTPYAFRQAQLGVQLKKFDLNAFVLNPGPSLTYLTGMHFHLMERPVIAILVPHEPLVLVLPELEAGKTDSLPYPVQVFTYGEDPGTWSGVFRLATKATNLKGRNVGVEPMRLRLLEFDLLRDATPEANWHRSEEVIAELRMRKDTSELEAMQKAVEIAQRALERTLPAVKIGVSEREIAAELTLQLLRAGSDAQIPFSPIVSGGANSADPHAFPSDRKLVEGDLLVVDWGASYRGYISDITRTFAMGNISHDLAEVHEVVQHANEAGRNSIRPGVSAGEIDQATRVIIERAGFGEFFIHRTGHGIGMEGHEPPYIRANNDMLVEPGMTFTIEPGIYLPGKGGVRIEDDVVVSQNGMESFSNMPRQLQVLDPN